MLQWCGSRIPDPDHDLGSDFLAWYQTCLITWNQVVILGPCLAFVTISELHSDSVSRVTPITTDLFGNGDFWLTVAVLTEPALHGHRGSGFCMVKPLHPRSLLQEWFLTLYLAPPWPYQVLPPSPLPFLVLLCLFWDVWTRIWHENHRPYRITMLISLFLP